MFSPTASILFSRLPERNARTTSGELLVRKQEVRTPIVEVPNVMDLLNKRRQTTGETVAPSIHSLK